MQHWNPDDLMMHAVCVSAFLLSFFLSFFLTAFQPPVRRRSWLGFYVLHNNSILVWNCYYIILCLIYMGYIHFSMIFASLSVWDGLQCYVRVFGLVRQDLRVVHRHRIHFIFPPFILVPSFGCLPVCCVVSLLREERTDGYDAVWCMLLAPLRSMGKY